MGAPPPSSAVSSAAKSAGIRMKREDCHRTKHDSSFSKWQILIGPSDWENYGQGKEGAERYRVENLPGCSKPGLYEIGVAVLQSGSGREIQKLNPDQIVVVYLGQAANVRARLQKYGRSGAHLGKGSWYGFGSSNGQNVVEVGNGLIANGAKLFKEVFLRGYPIVYRWAPMNSKSEAQWTETELLEQFDYAWNKVGNGVRRPNDILHKINKIASKTHQVPKIIKLLQSLDQKKVGIKIKSNKAALSNTNPYDTVNRDTCTVFSGVFKLSRSRPRAISEKPGLITEGINMRSICGVILSDGTNCQKPAVQGRKRCYEHKGRRVTAVVASEPATRSPDTSTTNPVPVATRSPDGQVKLSIVEKPQSTHENANNHCGVNLGNGDCCKKQPRKGRKRCEEHKGMRVLSLHF